MTWGTLWQSFCLVFDTLLSPLRKVERAAKKYQQFILRFVAYIELLKWNCFWAVLTVFYYDENMKKKPRVFVLDVARGGETAPTAGGNCSYSTVTAVIISSCSVSGSFHHQAGCVYIGHDWIKYLKSYIHAIYNSALAVIGSAARGHRQVVFMSEGWSAVFGEICSRHTGKCRWIMQPVTIHYSVA